MEAKKDEISLVELYQHLARTFTFIWQKKLTIVVIAIMGAVIGFTYAVLTPIKYNAKLSFIVEEQASPNLGGIGGIASNFGFSSFSGNNGLYNNQVNLINYFKSRSVIEEALLSPSPGNNETFASIFMRINDWDDEPDLKQINLNKTSDLSLKEDSLLFEMYNLILEDELLKVSVPDDDGSIIQINFISEDQDFAIHFTERLLDVVAKNYLSAKTKLASDKVAILQHQTDSVRLILNRALVENASATDQIFGLNPAYAVERVPSSNKRVDIEVSNVVLKELVKNLEMAKVQLLDQAPLIEVIDPPKYPLEEVKNGKIITALKFGIIAGFLTLVILLILRMFKKLHKAAATN